MTNPPLCLEFAPMDDRQQERGTLARVWAGLLAATLMVLALSVWLILTPEDGAPVPQLMLDLNSVEEGPLGALPAIGPALAGRIVADRTSRGAFASVEDLMRVRGIGPKTLEKVSPFLHVTRAPGAGAQ